MALDELHCKVILLGNSGTGKTALITRWISDSFIDNGKATIGCSHHRKAIDLEGDGSVTLCIWDTAGQERFQSLIPLYARSSALAIITAAVNDRASFDAVPQWVEMIAASGEPPPPAILAVNKMDLAASAVMTVEEIHDKYDANFAGIFFVSARTADNVDQLFCAAAIEAKRFTELTTKPAETALDPSLTKHRCC